MYRLFIAKSGMRSCEWLPLWMHLKDTSEIMRYLLDYYVSDSFAVSCGIDEALVRKTLIFIAYVHDIGKATVIFQYKISLNVTGRRYALESMGLEFPDSPDLEKGNKTPHGLAGEEILRYFGCNESVAAVVGAHHGVPVDSENIRKQNLKKAKKDIVGYANYFGNSESNRKLLEDSWNTIINNALEYAGFESIKDVPDLSVHAQMVISGLLVIADWIASNTEYFPLISEDDIGDDKLYPNRTNQALDNMSFPDKWIPSRFFFSDTMFKQMYSFSPNDIQRKVIDIAVNNNSSGIFILEAPMGCGKTEAALSATEILASRFKKSGLFFGLPTQATANGIFSRIQNWAEKQSDYEKHSIQLKHGSSAMNKKFREIQQGINEKEVDEGLVVHSWFCDNKKACLDNFVVATVDQMLMLALERRHTMLLHFGLSEKVVIIDEVHAYDAYMNQYLERAIQWLGAYKTPVILLSATLPAKRRMSLIRAYLQTSVSPKCFEENSAYPLLTWTDEKEICQQELPYDGEHKSVSIFKCCYNDIVSKIKDAAESGGCVGIILNTVSRAQKLAEQISGEVTDNVLLYHAQYIMPDRAKKESELLMRIGKSGNAETRRGLVVIGTQVLEQSLDIDFDLLITDVCPMDLFLQRTGRLHRHNRDHRPDKYKDPQCFLITDEFYNEKTGSKSIYGEWLLRKTLEYLPQRITVPDDISPLVQKVYVSFDDSDEYQKYIKDQQDKEYRANTFLLDTPDDTIDDTIHGILSRQISDTDEEIAEASVRDGISSIEVLVMQKKSDGRIFFLDGTPLSADLTDDECERVAEQKLRLPTCFSRKWNIDKVIKEIECKSIHYIEKWQRSHWLKKQLVLFLNDDLKAELSGYDLKYSFEYGLLSERSDVENE